MPGGFDPELLRRLDALAVANARVRTGDVEADQIWLCLNLNDQEKVADDRPAVGFRLEPLRRQRDTWSFLGRIDDAVGYLRFLLDLHLENVPPLVHHQLDMEHLPGVELTIRRHPEYEHGELARQYCAMGWRVEIDASFLADRSDGPVRAGTVVMATQTTRKPFGYTSPGSGSWVLLKCSQPGPFYIAFDSTTGDAEMFPGRRDLEGYAFALELLRVVA